MGNPVTVDSDDLEKILMVTGATKEIEKLLYKQKSDPFVEKDFFKIQDAHDRVARLWCAATRSFNSCETGSLSISAMQLLSEIRVASIKQIPHSSITRADHLELTKRMLIEYGNGHEIIFWLNSGEQQRYNSFPHLMARLTQHGHTLLAQNG